MSVSERGVTWLLERMGRPLITVVSAEGVELSRRMSLDEGEYRVRWRVAPRSESIYVG
jgi:hypothetical protein